MRLPKYTFSGLLLLNLLLLGVSYFKKDVYPPSTDLLPQLYTTPVQSPTTTPAFQQTINDVTYTVQPHFNYELSGLVTSWHNSNSWLDYVHNYWNDYINLKDLCLIWGTNLDNNLYHQLSFRNGSFSCSYNTTNTAAWEMFSEDAVANNHLLAATPEIAKKIMETSSGDQIYLRGYLVDYSTTTGWSRTTSVTRDDRGMGACEIIYVTDYTILRRNHPIWRWLYSTSAVTLCLLLVIKILFFFINNRPRSLRTI